MVNGKLAAMSLKAAIGYSRKITYVLVLVVHQGQPVQAQTTLAVIAALLCNGLACDAAAGVHIRVDEWDAA